jgi:hypothetical protein
MLAQSFFGPQAVLREERARMNGRWAVGVDAGYLRM